MQDRYFDPKEYIQALQQLLVSDKKRIAFMFGAGTSVLAEKDKDTYTIPAVAKMTEITENKLNELEKFRLALTEIKEEIGCESYNIETFLSNIEEKKQIIGRGRLNGLLRADFDELVSETKKQIIDIVSVHETILDSGNINNLIHVDFAEWIGQAERKYPIEIFTTNYDYLFELGLEEKEVPYYDGFTGSYRPFFNSESIEDMCFLPKQTKLWKLHGSLGWYIDSQSLGVTGNRVIKGNSDEDNIIIYPSILKYDNSKKQPYISLMDRLSNYLRQPDSILIVCGYSFRDQHINERIITALRSNTLSHAYVLLHDNVSNRSDILKIASENSGLTFCGQRDAVIGCKYGKWKLKNEPDKEDTINIDTYFDEDGPSFEDTPLGTENKGKEIWTGEGKLIISDFAKFINFLHNMI